MNDPKGNAVDFGGQEPRSIKVVKKFAETISGPVSKAIENLGKKLQTNLIKPLDESIKKAERLSRNIGGKVSIGSGHLATSFGAFTPTPVIGAVSYSGGPLIQNLYGNRSLTSMKIAGIETGAGPLVPAVRLGTAKATFGAGDVALGGAITSGYRSLGTAGAWAARGVLGLGAFSMAAMPKAEDAAAQRILAQSVATYSGQSAKDLIRSSNSIFFKSGGLTSATGAQEAMAAIAYSGGYLPGSGTFKNIMPQVGALSTMTGMSNGQVAGAYSKMNTMNALSLGVNIRDRKGQILPPNVIADQLYRRMYGNRKITADQAALVFNPNSFDYQNVMALANGDQDLFNAIATNIRLQQANGGKLVSNMTDANKLMNQLGIPQDDPMRNIAKNNKGKAQLLETTSDELVKSFSDSAAAAGKLAKIFGDLVDILGPFGKGLTYIKGFFDSFPGMNSVSSAISTTATAAFGLWGGKKIITRAARSAAAKLFPAAAAAEEAAETTSKLLGPNGEPITTATKAVSSASRAGSALGKVGGFFGKLFTPLFVANETRKLLSDPFGQKQMQTAKNFKSQPRSVWDWIKYAVGAGGDWSKKDVVSGPQGGLGDFGWGSTGTSMFKKDVVPGPQGGGNTSAGGLSAVGAKISSLVKSALSFVGRVPYVWGGRSSQSGWDCSGFVQSIFAKAGINLPRTAAEQARVGVVVPGLAQAQPGDLLFFHYSGQGAGRPHINHVAIYIGNGMMVEAANKNAGTRTSRVNTKALVVIKRVVGGKLGASYKQLMDALQGRGVKITGTSGDTGAPDSVTGGWNADNSGIHGFGSTTVNELLGNIGSAIAGAARAVGGLFSGHKDKNGKPQAEVPTVDASKGFVGNSNAHTAYVFFRRKGYTPEASAGIIGNLMQESSVNPRAVQAGGGPGRGVAQWSVDGRWQTLRKYATNNRKDPWELNTQLHFIIKEMSSHNYRMADTLKHMKDIRQATEYFEKKYEKAGTPNMKRRHNLASAAFDKFRNSYAVGAEDVTHDQVANIHKGEMILTADVAERVRRGKGGAQVNIYVTLTNASNAEAMRLVSTVKNALEHDALITKVGQY